MEFEPVASISDVDEWLPFIETLALFNRNCAIDDLDWDEDQLLKSLLDEITDVSLRSDYAAEPKTGIQVAKDRFLSDLLERLKQRERLLGRHYPFVVIGDGAVLITRKPTNQLSEASIAYLWLTIFWLISSDSDYLILRKDHKESFIREFSKIFEWICCIVVSSRSSSLTWYFGDSRDVREFLRRLDQVISVVGNGKVKSFADLEQNQTGANDAGVDIFSIQTHNGQIRPNATSYLVSVTIQKSDRRGKIIGSDQIERYKNYFDRRPTLTYQGILAIPFEGTDIEIQNCRDRNCGYITKSEILQDLANYPGHVQRIGGIRQARRKMRQKSREALPAVILNTKDGETRIDWE